MVIASILCFVISMSGEGSIGWEGTKDFIKSLSVALFLTLLFLGGNLVVFGRCIDVGASATKEEEKPEPNPTV